MQVEQGYLPEENTPRFSFVVRSFSLKLLALERRRRAPLSVNFLTGGISLPGPKL